MWWLDSGVVYWGKETALMKAVLFSSSFKSYLKNLCWPDASKIWESKRKEIYHWYIRVPASCWHWSVSLVWLTCSVNSLNLIGFCLEGLLCSADVKCKCNTAQVRNKSEALRPHLSLFRREMSLFLICACCSQYKDRIDFVLLSKTTFWDQSCEFDCCSSWSSVVTVCGFSHMNLLLLGLGSRGLVMVGESQSLNSAYGVHCLGIWMVYDFSVWEHSRVWVFEGSCALQFSTVVCSYGFFLVFFP